MIIQHNMASIFANGKLNISEKRRADSTEKLSSGYRINRSADDAAGLSISEKMRWQIRGLDKASQNIADGMSLLQVADGALNESHAVLQRMNELAVQAANDTNTDVDRDAIQLEMDELSEELTRIAETTSFNSEIYPLLGGNGTSSIQWPSELLEVPVTILNDHTEDVIYNGVTYKSGETIVVNNMLSMKGDRGYYKGNYLFKVGIGSLLQSGAGSIGGNTSQLNFTTTRLFGNSFKKDCVIVVPLLDDVKIDENGYLYYTFEALGDDNRLYLSKSEQWLGTSILDENGTYSGTPPAQECEARNVLRVDINTAQISGEIKIQSSALANQSIDIPLVNATAANLGVEYLDVMTHTPIYYKLKKAIMLVPMNILGVTLILRCALTDYF